MLAIPSKERSPEELEFLEAMSILRENPLFQMLAEQVGKESEGWVNTLARGIALTGGPHAEPVNQRVIDYQRGFWNGAIYAVTQFPRKKAKDWDKFVAEATKESDVT